MKRIVSCLISLIWLILPVSAQELTIKDARFSVGDNPEWKATAFDDSGWKTLSLDKAWNDQGVSNNYAYAWYRIRVTIPSTLKNGSVFNDKILIDLGPIDDCDETYLNGVLIGKTGGMPDQEGGYESEWDTPREYLVEPKMVLWDKENVIAVRVYNGGEPGGFFEGNVQVRTPGLKDMADMAVSYKNGGCEVALESTAKLEGSLEITETDLITEETLPARTIPVTVSPKKAIVVPVGGDGQKRLTVTYRDKRSGETIEKNFCLQN